MPCSRMEPVAIVGMACRLPGQCRSTEEFWNMISEGRTGHAKVPKGRFDADAWYHPHHERRGAIQSRSGFFLEEDPYLFDAPFFSITAKEAAGMDPMQRKLLEISYESFENAGIPMKDLSGSMTSVYTGVMTNDYERASQDDTYNLPQNAASGTSKAMLSNRVSWFLNLRGPSLTLDTACSSSLYAFHLACQSIRTGESRTALVTGVNLILNPNFISQLSSMHMLSPDGISHSFDSRANGYARGDAIAGIVLKPLSAAIADGDTIRAVVRSTATNQDGRTPGITVPSSEAQAALIRTAYDAAGLSYDQTAYFEAHGTGTSVGDPIELKAIADTFGKSHRMSSENLKVGSVKTNIGHTEGSAGIAGVIKAVLALENGLIPPSVGIEKINPRLQLDDWRVSIPTELTPWPVDGVRRASVNSFGFGGSNAHAILDDAYHYFHANGIQGHHRTHIGNDVRSPGVKLDEHIGNVQHNDKETDQQHLFVVSSHDQAGIKRFSGLLQDVFQAKKDIRDNQYLRNIAYTLASRRTQFDFRSFVVASNMTELATNVALLPSAKRIVKNENVIFIFTGQGAQWAGMGRELLSHHIFRNSMEKSQEYIEALGAKWNAIELLSNTKSSKIDKPEFCQPICTFLQIALVELLRYWGIFPAATVGHSSGEIGAAYAAGGISHASAIKIAFYRGLYVEEVERRLDNRKGAMLAAGLSEEEALGYLKSVTEGLAVIGCVNSPTSVTISGDEHVLDFLENMIRNDGKFARKLRVGVAYHSPHMNVVAEDFLTLMGDLETTEQFAVPMFSSVAETVLAEPKVLDSKYWVKNMVSAVRFSGAVQTMLQYKRKNERGRISAVDWASAVELGPHETLKGPFTQIMDKVKSRSTKDLKYISLIRRRQHALTTALEAAGSLWSRGYPVDLSTVTNGEESEKQHCSVLTDLPAYPWHHSKAFVHDTLASSNIKQRTMQRTDLLGVAVDDYNPHQPQWRNLLTLQENPWMEDHAITGTILYPAAGMLIMAMEGLMQLMADKNVQGVTGVEFEDITFDRGLVIPSLEEAVETRLNLVPHESLPSSYRWTVFSLPPGGIWIKNCWGVIRSIQAETGAADLSWASHKRKLEHFNAQAEKEVDVASFYEQLATIGMGYGPLFTNMIRASAVSGAHTATGTITIPDTKARMPGGFEFRHYVHPATLDAIFHLIFVALYKGEAMKQSAVPVFVDNIYISTDLPQGAGNLYTGYSEAHVLGLREAIGDIVVSDAAQGSAKIVVRGMMVREVSDNDKSLVSQASQTLDSIPRRTAKIEWHEDIDFLEGYQWSKALSVFDNAPDVIDLAIDVDHSGLKLAKWIDLACHKKQNMRVLVVNHALLPHFSQALSRFGPMSGGERRFGECVIACSRNDDCSASADMVALTGTKTGFKAIDVFAMESQQQAKLDTFDLIVAGVDEDASSQVTDLFEAAQRLLDSDGTLAVLAMSAGKFASKQDWAQTMAKHGLYTPKVHTTDGTADLIITSKASQTAIDDTSPLEVTLLVSGSRLDPNNMLDVEVTIADVFKARGYRVELAVLSDAAKLKEKTCVSLLEIKEPLVLNWTEEEMKNFRTLASSVRSLLWITSGGILEKEDASLDFAPTTGLLRVMRNEYPEVRTSHLDISRHSDALPADVASLVVKVMERTLSTKGASKAAIETELVEMGGSIFIPRVLADASMDSDLELHSEEVRPVNKALGRVPLRLQYGPAKSLKTVRWVADDVHVRPLGSDEVDIQTTHVLSSGITVTEDAEPYSQPLTQLASGIITAVGSEVPLLVPGNGVIALCSEAFKTSNRLQYSLVRKLPDYVSSAEAISCVEPAMTAVHALLGAAQLGTGDTVLIHGVAEESPFSDALLQIARYVGATSIVSVGSCVDREALSLRHGIGSDHIIAAQDATLPEAIKKATAGKGVDVLVNIHGTGIALRHLAHCLCKSPRVVCVNGQPSASDMEKLSAKPNVTFATVDINFLSDASRAKLLKCTVDMLGNRILTVLPSMSSAISISQFHETLRSSSTAVGATGPQVAIEFDPGDQVPMLPAPPARPELDPEATYMISGGLGALGLTIADEMAKSGARHLVLLSRSGATTERQHKALASLRDEFHCKVDTPECDITQQAQVDALTATAREQQWKIRGVVQCAMVLRDSIFENMTFSQWTTATTPKIRGTLNLHHALTTLTSSAGSVPVDLHFFILLSSMSGIIGNTAQANYAAGNTFEDAFAHWRRAQGLAATSLNVGLVTDASHFTATNTLADYMKKFGGWRHALVTDAEMQVAIAAAMRGSTADGKPVGAQVLVGVSAAIERDDITAWPQDPKFNHRIRADAGGASRAGKENSVEQRVRAAAGSENAAAETRATVEAALRKHVAAAMTAEPDDIDVGQPLYSFGVDSLKAVEVRNWIMRELKADISVFDLLSPTPLAKLAGFVVAKSAFVAPEVARELEGVAA